MTSNTGLFNQRFAKNFIPLPGFTVPSVGDLAPDFSLPQIGGKTLKLSDYRGKQPVILAFTRIFTEKLFCPYCYPHIKELKDRYQDIRDQGAELLMISSTDSIQSQEIVTELNLPYPFLFDPECKTFRLYGAGQALGAPLPAQFIINQEGRITYRHLFSFIDGNASTDQILTQLKPLTHNS
ncbi:peroxiredoxin family protein [Gloeothece verrucosa]|uniref:Alkyl hydroperoxide reductase/ Thiol specific antioxidant/ Mal allergen n=1 Tax=Gloeothece verrucosa (strain PCC 7822) TaxID=497965 RepID=E0UDU6_GLOV7|nr:peroxiredoxin family protein [Gloeothece verrucosa]ADN16531.1 alkyl hydroperoxide reductase/ Thiol specific antioxidant/ Mal allergen [Gloeothece verrucosa PCC 7822]